MLALWAHDTRLGRAAVVSVLVDADAMTNDLGPADVLGPTVQVTLELRARPGCYLTTATLCELTGLTAAEVHHAIGALSKSGKILRFLPADRAGRKDGQAYAWNYRGVS